MTPNFGAKMDIGKGTIGSKLDVMVGEGAEGSDEVGGVVVEFSVAGDGTYYIMEDKFFLWAPDLLAVFIDDGVLVGVDVVSKGATWGGPEVREELVLGVERDDRKREFLKDRSEQGRRWDNSDGGLDNSGQEVFYRDVHEQDTVNNFLKLEVDVSVLGFVGGGILELWA